MPNLPASGSRIIFDAVPFGSYARPNVPYIITIEGKSIHLANIATGAGTFDAAWRYRNAAWRHA